MGKKSNDIKNLAVFCASSDGNDQQIFNTAYEVGKRMAENKINLVYGGSKLGLMGQVAKGVMDHGGYATGVIPDFLKTKEVVPDFLFLNSQVFSHKEQSFSGYYRTSYNFLEFSTIYQLQFSQDWFPSIF